ncbi:MAG: DUF1116 domain-containing protein [Bacteroidales bacterium]|nr:DUF1116 domain-containing protein [Bacteroidales bacterium]MDZ4203341.1 DUF1116 domain-containing protein [Bacteroidales bacterium]
MAIKEIFNLPLQVVNIGLESFKDNIQNNGEKAIQVKWQPPAVVSSAAVSKLDENFHKIEEANKKVLEIILSGKPVLKSMDVAINVIPGMQKNLILHAGPPISWNRMCGPTRGAIMGALIYEGMAKTPEQAEKLAASGAIEFAPCHEHSSVGPMAGIISASMPVFIVENETSGNEVYCTLNEGLGKVLRYGAYGPEVIEKLRWMGKVMYPILKTAIEHLGKVDLKNIIAQALHMGDEVHNRNRAATSLLYRILAPAIVETSKIKEDTVEVLNFINGNDHFFLNLSMPAAKCCLDAARNIPYSSVVVAMARNGTDFGVQLAGTGNKWFTGPALVPDALFFPGYTKEDANPDIGDSAITETLGLGGFAIAAAPAIVQFVGGTAKDAIKYTMDMYEITAGENNVYQIPYLNFRGTPTGIDVRKVIENNITPFIDTGVAHKNPGVGQIGAGVSSAPIEPFIQAYEGLANEID